MVRSFLKITFVLIILIVGLVGLAAWKPMVASRLLWPTLERIMLREPFVGITTDGAVREGLFRIESTGASTLAVRDAAQGFLDTLTEQQRNNAMFGVEDLEWRRWANVHLSHRQGVGLLELDEEQTVAAFRLLAVSLSERGLQTSTDIMRLEGHLADLMNDFDQYGEKRYWLTIMGEPSLTEPWGWQIDGHHLVINFFVLGDQVVMTPTFMGSEPPRASSGRFSGIAILEQELAAGLAFINALDTHQRSMAIIDPDKVANNNRGELFQDNALVAYEGVKLSTLTPGQREIALGLIGLYIGNARAEHANVKMNEILRHWNETRFAWVGGTQP
ncbi:MAG: DUF3500 domain-containing protein, partial [Gammaproteobacteria bacterium]|nr:DUF3500 domain-containing protein [Gammaproteobacteria bacterium]